MQFTTFLAASVAVTGALAGVGYEAPAPEPEYTTTTSCSKSVVPEYETTSAPVYEPTDSPEPTDYGCSDVVYTSYSTYENPADYAVYTSTYYSTSKCPEVVPVPTYVPPAKNCTTSSAYEVPVDYATPTDYATPEPTDYATEEPETYTKTYYTTVCPGKAYCYGTTVTSTYCPATETHVPSYVPEPEHPTKSYEHVPTYEPVPPPTYTKPAYNETVPPPPSYTGAASSNTISFGAAAFAGLVALFVAA
jgi:hypothetical protein